MTDNSNNQGGGHKKPGEGWGKMMVKNVQPPSKNFTQQQSSNSPSNNPNTTPTQKPNQQPGAGWGSAINTKKTTNIFDQVNEALKAREENLLSQGEKGERLLPFLYDIQDFRENDDKFYYHSKDLFKDLAEGKISSNNAEIENALDEMKDQIRILNKFCEDNQSANNNLAKVVVKEYEVRKDEWIDLRKNFKSIIAELNAQKLESSQVNVEKEKLPEIPPTIEPENTQANIELQPENNQNKWSHTDKPKIERKQAQIFEDQASRAEKRASEKIPEVLEKRESVKKEKTQIAPSHSNPKIQNNVSVNQKGNKSYYINPIIQVDNPSAQQQNAAIDTLVLSIIETSKIGGKLKFKNSDDLNIAYKACQEAFGEDKVKLKEHQSLSKKDRVKVKVKKLRKSLKGEKLKEKNGYIVFKERGEFSKESENQLRVALENKFKDKLYLELIKDVSKLSNEEKEETLGLIIEKIMAEELIKFESQADLEQVEAACDEAGIIAFMALDRSLILHTNLKDLTQKEQQTKKQALVDKLTSAYKTPEIAPIQTQVNSEAINKSQPIVEESPSYVIIKGRAQPSLMPTGVNRNKAVRQRNNEHMSQPQRNKAINEGTKPNWMQRKEQEESKPNIVEPQQTKNRDRLARIQQEMKQKNLKAETSASERSTPPIHKIDPAIEEKQKALNELLEDIAELSKTGGQLNISSAIVLDAVYKICKQELGPNNVTMKEHKLRKDYMGVKGGYIRFEALGELSESKKQAFMRKLQAEYISDETSELSQPTSSSTTTQIPRKGGERIQIGKRTLPPTDASKSRSSMEISEEMLSILSMETVSTAPSNVIVAQETVKISIPSSPSYEKWHKDNREQALLDRYKRLRLSSAKTPGTLFMLDRFKSANKVFKSNQANREDQIKTLAEQLKAIDGSKISDTDKISRAIHVLNLTQQNIGKGMFESGFYKLCEEKKNELKKMLTVSTLEQTAEKPIAVPMSVQTVDAPIANKPRTHSGLNLELICETSGWKNNCGLNCLTHFLYSKLENEELSGLIQAEPEKYAEYQKLQITFQEYYNLSKTPSWDDIKQILSQCSEYDREIVFAPVLRLHLGKVLDEKIDKELLIATEVSALFDDYFVNGIVQDITETLFKSNQKYLTELKKNYLKQTENGLPEEKSLAEEYYKTILNSYFLDGDSIGFKNYFNYIASLNNMVMVSADHLQVLSQALNIGAEVYTPQSMQGQNRPEEDFAWTMKVYNKGSHWQYEEPNADKKKAKTHNLPYEANHKSPLKNHADNDRVKAGKNFVSAEIKKIAEQKPLDPELTTPKNKRSSSRK